MLPESSLVFSGLHSAMLAFRINNNKFYHYVFQEICWVLSLKDYTVYDYQIFIFPQFMLSQACKMSSK